MTTVHVIGAGLAGLSCAVRCATAGRKIALYEAAGHAGGRCRSFSDESLGTLVDTGTHIMVGAYAATQAFLADVGARDSVQEIAPAAYPFIDLARNQRWVVRPSSGLIPSWIWTPSRRVLGAPLGDYVRALRLARAREADTIGDLVGRGVLYDRLWQPLSRAILNTDADEASARLMWRAIALTFAKGEAACRPILFTRGLSPALIDPALAVLKRHNAEVRFMSRLRAVRLQADRVSALEFAEGVLRVEPGDAVVIAVPPDAAAELLPGLTVPRETRAIVNAHFRMEERPELPGGLPFIGVVGAESQWLFVRDGLLSVTISAADGMIDQPAFEIATRLWAEVCRVLGRNVGRMPSWRVIKEKRATMAQTPAMLKLRPSPQTAIANLFLAGDWTDTGLPATIEGAIRSGYRAAQLALAAKAPPSRSG